MSPMTTTPEKTVRPEPGRSFVDRYFKITERGSTVGREVRGGLVTFFAMSYIIILNPLILGGVPDMNGETLGGPDGMAKIAAVTALVAGLLTIAMGVVANFPLALAAGLGINALIAYQVVGAGNVTWADAMGLVVIEGIIILVLVLTGFREAVFRAVPVELKTAISVGIGLFIAFVGFVNGGFVSPGGGTPLELGASGSLAGWPVLVFVIGLALAIVLSVRKVRGALLIAIAAATVLAVILESTLSIGTSSEDNPTGWHLNAPAVPDSLVAVPDFSLLGQFSLLGSFERIGAVAVVLLVFSLLLADFFDTMGTMVAVGGEAGLLDEEGNPPNTRRILVVDSVAAIAGGAASVSSNTSYVESATGVGEGARTGLASVVTGCAFLLSTFLAPLVGLVPEEAATPALVFVGFLMMTQVTGIRWTDWEIAIPAFLTIVLMPFTYSISVGLGAGFIAFVLIKVAVGKARAIHPLMWLAAAMFVVYFTIGPIENLLGVNL
ncbi:AGZA family xanthine/uracil permease-like MFS transporter [Sediminihabitans luteus]|uniref:AGZA family xanthine/uracil permease-like MFS transporter n=2 Tax=Sediminihabitans luteus TaxID=1138585 RepID=A0A2M9CE48_9CELL|nr:NCS2 family permease [Sediminihabitans luteus]PJJ70173.1 AGZA family xanthine/uracil permease-like MFS transporter [Sediminihabitans luteus]